MTDNLSKDRRSWNLSRIRGKDTKIMVIKGDMTMPHIHPVSELKNNLNHLSDICRKEHEPVYLTRRGRGELVLMGLEEYEGLLAKIKTVEDEDAKIEALWVAELQERYHAIQSGEVECIPAADAMRQARERIRR